MPSGDDVRSRIGATLSIEHLGLQAVEIPVIAIGIEIKKLRAAPRGMKKIFALPIKVLRGRFNDESKADE